MRGACRILAGVLTGLALPSSAPVQAAPPLAPVLPAPDPALRVARFLARGEAAARSGDPSSALAFFRDAVSAGPRDPRGYEALGRAYLQLGEPTRALEVFEVGAAATGGSEALWLGLAETQRTLRRPEAALASLHRLLAAAPDSPAGLQALLDAASDAGRWLDALNAARALLARAQAGSPPAALSAEPQPEANALRLRVRALELLLGPAERLRSPDQCERGSALARAIANCP